MIKDLTKNRSIMFTYIVYISYIFIKSMLFYKFHISPIDYLINFESGSYYIAELSAIYLIILFLLLKDDNIYYNYRLHYRIRIIEKQYKKIIVHAVIFVSLNFIISILLFNSVYNFFSIHPIIYYIFLSIIHILGYVLISGTVLLLNQMNNLKYTNSFILVYFLFTTENFVLYEVILSKKIPIIISWVFSDMNLFLRILILTFMNICLHRIVFNKSLKREFV